MGRSRQAPPNGLLRPLRGSCAGTLRSLAQTGSSPRQERARPRCFHNNDVGDPGRPCVDCHAFEFMQRALQDLRKTAYSLDARTETLLLQAERRALCACWPAGR
ncbi:neuropeptide-like protein C4orf48 homolog isoform X1 [Cricetulus griseus]|uniref:neuropeptide-like protein C4orf48 homolog isoform X1 n=1 Tax=Cricetulus griseus TaxID=10029 RepID=UPI00022F514B|nr:neuropeptide-like protein C4orf48 homolog isoform X1 [Cricetulus griseus]